MGDTEMTMSDPRILSPERLAEIRANHDDGWMTSMVATAELLDHIAAQAERIAELTAHAVRLHTWLTGDREFFDTDTIDAMRSIVELLYPNGVDDE